MNDLIRRVLARRGRRTIAEADYQDLIRKADLGWRLENVSGFLQGQDTRLAGALLASPSQLGQDLFVLSELGWKQGGTFVEFGAADGVTLSNSWLLEKHFGWTGILAEPARTWHAALARSGRSAAIDHDCVWSRSGESLTFHQHPIPEISALEGFNSGKEGSDAVASAYAVNSVSLNDLLDRHGAPPLVDYLSIDTEGSEYEILAAHDFRRHGFRVITCEHNHGPQREAIYDLLSARGYVRKFTAQSLFDDWYVLAARTSA